MIRQLAENTQMDIFSSTASNIAAKREEECDKIIDEQNQQIFNDNFNENELKFKVTLKKTGDEWGFQLADTNGNDVDPYLLENMKKTSNGGRSKKVGKRNRRSRSQKRNGR